MRRTLLTSAIALCSVMGFATIASAETVTTKTYIQQKDLPDMNKVNFSAFDVNQDGQFSMKEVGERLFESFDRDGNQLIDNLEWDHKAVMTIIPMEEETFQYSDGNSDGVPETATYEYDQFFEMSGLAKFDKNLNGLSAQEFIGTPFQKLDDDDNNLINMEEWKEVYLESVIPASAEQERYND